MSTIAWPAALTPIAFTLQLSVNQRSHAAPYGGSEQVVDLLNDRWTASISLPAHTHAVAAQTEGFVNALRGMTNTTALWHFGRTAPLGTVRGTLTASAAAQGAASLVISGCNPSNGTLKAGDMLGVGGLLVQVAADCTASGGSITVPLVNRLRKAVSGAVTWDKPTATFRLMNKAAPQYLAGYAEGVSLEFAEVIA